MAEDLARSSGTPDEVLERVLGQDFLMRCLRKAKFSADLLQDTSDACEINDLNALVLGSGLLSVTEASEKLFLMQDEASTVVTVCRKECLRAGVNFGDGAKLTSEELAEKDDDEPTAPASAPPAPVQAPAPAQPPTPVSASAPAHSPAPAQSPAPTHPAIQVPPAPTHAPPNRTSPGAHDVRSQKQPVKPGAGAIPSPTSAASGMAAAPAAAASFPRTFAAVTKESEPAAQRPVGASTSGEQPDPNFLIKPPGAAQASAAANTPNAGTPFSIRSHIPKPNSATPSTPAVTVGTPRERPAAKPATRASPSTTMATPPTSSGGVHEAGFKAANTPAMNGKHTPAASSSAARPPRPSSAPLTARASTTAPLGKDRPVSAVVTPPVQSARLPSYAKPTASHKARLLKEDTDVPSSSLTPPITFASTNKPLRRLLYMAPRPTSTTPEEKKEPKKPIFDNIRSSLLRPTAAFLAWSSGKSKPTKESDLRSSQSLQAMQSEASAQVSRAKAPNSAPPKSMPRDFSATTVSALSPSISQGGMKPTTTPEPFRLASAERHQKAQEELARKKEEKARLESLIPKFKASPMPGAVERPMSGKPDAKRTMAAQTEA